MIQWPQIMYQNRQHLRKVVYKRLKYNTYDYKIQYIKVETQ